MSFESDLHNYLEMNATIATILGGRVYPLVAPQDVTRPYAVVEFLDGQPEYHATGESGVSTASITIDVYADKYADAISAKEAIRQKLSGKQAVVGSTPIRFAFTWRRGALRLRRTGIILTISTCARISHNSAESSITKNEIT